MLELLVACTSSPTSLTPSPFPTSTLAIFVSLLSLVVFVFTPYYGGYFNTLTVGSQGSVHCAILARGTLVDCSVTLLI